jgi:LacI family repressor for deo operon, udp, cdd, tsx, nupC, and nupG
LLLADPYNRLTAICCASDERVIGVILAARHLGLSVPDQLSVIGVYNHPLGMILGLTTIAQSVQDQGTRAARALLDELAGPQEGSSRSLPELTEFPVKIVTRLSIAAPVRGRNPTFH